MKRAILGIFAAAVVAAGGVFLGTETRADDRLWIGTARLFTNDMLGDGNDRWRTGSYSYSKFRSPDRWRGALPDEFGALVEWRARMEILAPANLQAVVPGDRRYAGSLSLGYHTYFQRGRAEIRTGADVIFVGPGTGVSRAHKLAHGVLGAPEPDDAVLANQMPNAIYPTISGEAGLPFQLGEQASLRPFVAARVGDENLLRLGVDVLIGGPGQKDLWARDVTTGQRYRATFGHAPGVSLMLGGDIAYVASSKYLDPDDGITPKDMRARLRAGVNWQTKSTSVFYGLTWLGREFEGQATSQVVGSLALRRSF